jgi:hypothetical protein
MKPYVCESELFGLEYYRDLGESKESFAGAVRNAIDVATKTV